MIKQSTTALSPYAAVFLSPAHGIHFQHGFTSDADGGAGSVRTWLRLVRTGALITAYRSADGATWTAIGTTTLTGPATAGLFVTSHNGSALNTTTFDQLSLTRRRRRKGTFLSLRV